jgi:hypothetical protein
MFDIETGGDWRAVSSVEALDIETSVEALDIEKSVTFSMIF